jgi:serine/threonine-protein kinase
MGEVYRAKDTKLGRDVALKILPASFTNDPERVARFRREAQMLASLNHPHIAQIHGLEDVDGTQFLVLELVDGESLDKRIARGRIPVDEALGIAKQIAEALEAAHEKGIIHRDLKPANIALNNDGTVKVLDFGLAKAVEATSGPSVDAMNSPTITSPAMMTGVGVILGTAAYMSPEQAKGRAADKRSDIWAFGCVLYEMVTGRRLYDGDSVSETLAAVLTQEPAWEQVPIHVQRLLRGCLQKDPGQRLHDIADAELLLSLDDALQQPPGKSSSRVGWKVAAAALAVLATLALWRAARPVETKSPSLVRLDLDLGPDVLLRSAAGSVVILSPDGTRLAFVSQGTDGTRRLFTRRLDEPRAARLTGTEGAYTPFFSPDGQWVGFFAQGKLKKTRIDSGEPVSLCDAPAGRGGSWGEDGNIIATLDALGGLSQVPAEGGKPVPVTDLSPGEQTHRWPQVLPGAHAVLFTASSNYGNFDEAAVAVVSLNDHRKKTLLEHGGMYPRYLQSGHLVYVTKGTLFSVPFDLERLEVRGPPIVAEHVSRNSNIGDAQIDFSRSGTFVFRTGGTEGLTTIQWLDAAGKTVSLGIEPAIYYAPHLSPDGSRLASVVNQGASSELWVYDWQRGGKTLLLRSDGALTSPVWNPGGQFVVFQAAGGTLWTRADGAGKPQPLTRGNTQYPSSFTPDGTRLAFSELTNEGGEIRTVPVESASGQLRAGEPQVFLKTATANAWPTFSPDGRWLAYADAEAGRYEVFVRAFPDTNTKVQISTAGGMMPVWSRMGHELFYRTEDQQIMVVNYLVNGESFIADRPRLWAGRQLADRGLGVNFDLAPDSKRFVVLMPTDSPESRETQSHVTIELNFFDELRRIAPVKH